MTRKSISITWHIEDVQQLVQERFDKNISDEDALEVLDCLVRKHDANNGINWDVIECAVEYLLESAAITLF